MIDIITHDYGVAYVGGSGYGDGDDLDYGDTGFDGDGYGELLITFYRIDRD